MAVDEPSIAADTELTRVLERVIYAVTPWMIHGKGGVRRPPASDVRVPVGSMCPSISARRSNRHSDSRKEVDYR